MENNPFRILRFFESERSIDPRSQIRFWIFDKKNAKQVNNNTITIEM